MGSITSVQNLAKLIKRSVVGRFDNFVFEFRKEWHDGHISDYYDCPGNPIGHVLVSRTASPFFMCKSSQKYINHQSNWKAIDIADIFNDLDYAVDVYEFDDPDAGPQDYSKYDIVFGTGRNFAKFANAVPDECRCIYYGGGNHWKYQNTAEQSRLRRLERRRGVTLDPNRRVPEIDIGTLADAMILMSDGFTKKTYRPFVGELPIYTVPNAGFDFLDFDPDEQDYERARTNFLYFGGSGSVLKGLDLALEVFATVDDVDLYVCGPVEAETEFKEIYKEELYHTENIHTVGWTNIRSEEFTTLTRKCAFSFYPSASEAAFPGAIINTMHRGVVPITSKACVADTDDFGWTVPNTRLDTLAEYVRQAASTDPAAVRKRSINAKTKVSRDHSREAYNNALESALESILAEDHLDTGSRDN